MIDSEKLIEAVRDRRALYDHRMVEYSNKPLVNALWMDVAKELDTSVEACKVKWTGLRSSYARSRRELRTGIGRTNKRKRMWYLSDAMSFLDDFMFTHQKVGSNDGDYYDNSDGYLDDDEENIRDIDDTVSSGDNDESVSASGRLTSKSIREKENSNCLNVEASESLLSENRNRLRKELLDPDLLFFRSLIPDVKSLTDQNKRKFKETVLCTLNKILNDEEKNNKSRDTEEYITVVIKPEPE